MAHVSLFIGQVQPLPVSGRPTAMYKTSVQAPIELGVEGFAGDQRADLVCTAAQKKLCIFTPARTMQSWPRSLQM